MGSSINRGGGREGGYMVIAPTEESSRGCNNTPWDANVHTAKLKRDHEF